MQLDAIRFGESRIDESTKKRPTELDRFQRSTRVVDTVNIVAASYRDNEITSWYGGRDHVSSEHEMFSEKYRNYRTHDATSVARSTDKPSRSYAYTRVCS